MTEPMQIVILEDNADRRRVMLDCLRDRFPQYEVLFFRSASEMVGHLQRHLGRVLAISLDHDLEPADPRSPEAADPGTGRDVANFLATRRPTCPVVIHSSNTFGTLGMKDVLDETHWPTYVVTPFDDTAWIAESWFPTVRRAIVDSIREVSSPASVSQPPVESPASQVAG